MAYIHREGRRFIGILFMLLLVLNLATYYFFPEHKIFQYGLGILSFLVLVFVLSFFRNPSRNLFLAENTVLAPADGKVVVIENVYEPEFFKEKRKQLSIFMSVKNVHINRNPISGNVKFVKYHPGKYLVAWHPKSSTENERTTIVIENDGITLLLRQIAGKIARRIVYYTKEGDSVIQGEELGFIKFGSRVDLFLPLNAEINVKLNQKVKGGKTVLAHY